MRKRLLSLLLSLALCLTLLPGAAWAAEDGQPEPLAEVSVTFPAPKAGDTVGDGLETVAADADSGLTPYLFGPSLWQQDGNHQKLNKDSVYAEDSVYWLQFVFYTQKPIAEAASVTFNGQPVTLYADYEALETARGAYDGQQDAYLGCVLFSAEGTGDPSMEDLKDLYLLSLYAFIRIPKTLTVAEVATAEELTGALSGGEDIVRLTDDITIGAGLKIGRDVTVDLNGYVLRYDETADPDSIFRVKTDCTLTLCDSRPAAEHEDETLPAGGLITGGKGYRYDSGSGSYHAYTYYGGGVYVEAGASFVLAGGTIYACGGQSDATSAFGGGIYCTGGSVTVTGGAIRDCKISADSTASGGGIYAITGSVTMTGGVIADCSARVGGGIHAGSSAVRITGGSIENCKASERGGGLSVSGHTNGPVSLLDAVISGCEANRGGGLYLGQFAELELGENARITGCTATETDDTEAGTVEYGAAVYMDLGDTYTANYPGTFLYANGGRVEGTVYVEPNSRDQRGIKATNAIDHTDGKPSTVFTGDVYCEGDIRGGSFYGSVTAPDPHGDMSNLSKDNYWKYCSNLSGGSFYGPVYTECHVSGGTYYAGLSMGETARFSGKPLDTGDKINDKTNTPNPNGKPVTVTYEYGELGGTYAEQIVQKGETAIRPTDPKVNGFTFLGWYTDENCTDESKYDFTATVTAGFTLYAKWEGTFYGIRITDTKGEVFYITDKNANNVLGDGTVSYVPGYVDAGKTFTNDDWNRALRGETVEGLQLPKLTLNGANLQNILMTGIRDSDADTLLLSSMLQIELVGDNKITCDGDGVDAIYARMLVITGRGSLNATATGQNAAAIAVDSEGGRYCQYGGDVTLYGAYSGICCSDAYFEFADGKLTVSSPKSALYCDLNDLHFKITSDTTTFFCGTSEEEAFEIQQPSVFENIVNRLEEGEFSLVPVPESQTILYAQLTANHTVTFDTDGGSEVKSLTVPYGETATAPEDPTKPGYTFAGWYLGEEKFNWEATPVRSDLTLSAHWTANRVPVSYGTLSFETNGGSAVPAQTLPLGSTVDLTKYTPAREGFAFTGWYRDRGLTERVTTLTLSASATVYAGWNPFRDVTEESPFYEDILFAYNQGLMQGKNAGTFAPGAEISRGQLAAVLWRLAGSPVVNYAMPFTDVAEDCWCAEAVRWAAAQGVVTGYADGSFRPDAAITRQQLAAFLYRYEKLRGGGFTGMWYFPLNFPDAGLVAPYADEAMHWCVMRGILQGGADGRLDPTGTASRAQAAAMLRRFPEK